VTLSPYFVGIVVIGRNEGDRLTQCLTTLPRGYPAVYVDSGSSDDSVAKAKRLSIAVCELSSDRPFTAGRARNAGFRVLREAHPQVELVQFLDGDCELKTEWINSASAHFHSEPEVGVVLGRLQERFPDASIYNRICQIEWDTPCGDVPSSGGIAMMQVEAFAAVGGFNETLIAGEEGDLCYRLRARGWKIHKIPADMAIHDAAMTRARQWWARSRRSGYSAAEAYALRGRNERGLLRNVVSNVVWALPLSWPFWPVLWLRTSRRHGRTYASHIVLGKIPHFRGQLDFWLDQLFKRKRTLIEHK